MHKQIFILCKTLEEEATGCRAWIPTCGDKGDERLRFEVAHPSARNAEGWGTLMGGKVKIPKNLGCATRRQLPITKELQTRSGSRGLWHPTLRQNPPRRSEGWGTQIGGELTIGKGALPADTLAVMD